MITKFVFSSVLHHFGLSLIIEKKLEYDIENNNLYSIADGPWYNTYICKKLHVTVFEKYIRNVVTDRYNLLCYINKYEKQHPPSVDIGSSSGGNALPSNFTKEVLA